jgi:hypothetical protein
MGEIVKRAGVTIPLPGHLHSHKDRHRFVVCGVRWFRWIYAARISSRVGAAVASWHRDHSCLYARPSMYGAISCLDG